jgi:hypothetical protein
VAGHKGQPDNVAEAGRKPRRRRLKGARGRGRLTLDHTITILDRLDEEVEVNVSFRPRKYSANLLWQLRFSDHWAIQSR